MSFPHRYLSLALRSDEKSGECVPRLLFISLTLPFSVYICFDRFSSCSTNTLGSLCPFDSFQFLIE